MPNTTDNKHDQANTPKVNEQEAPKKTGETGGPKGPEPTRFGDWERNGRCIDF